MKPFYFPIESGIYEVAPGLKPLGHDFGNGDLDSKVFQFDDDFAKCRAEKLAARKEDVTKYFTMARLSPEVERDAVETIVNRLVQEWAEHFELRGSKLECKLTNVTLNFDGGWRLVGAESTLGSSRNSLDAKQLADAKLLTDVPPYRNALDALFMQVQEDGAILSIDEQTNWLSMIHVMLPSHWDPREKIGHDFATFHKPIPGFERMASAQANIAQAMVTKGPFVRFVWSFVTDTRMNHHPFAPKGIDEKTWRGRTFDTAKQIPFYLRVERQLTLGLPKSNASLFFIRLSFIDGMTIKKDERMRTKLTSALKSMSPAARIYKGVDQCFDELVAWLA